jgi:hypothetical protein
MSRFGGFGDLFGSGEGHFQENESNGRVAIASSIDSALSMLGKDVREALLFHIQSRSGLVEEEFPFNPEKFGKALAAILGNGARVLESKVVGILAADPSAGLDSENFATKMTSATSYRLSTPLVRGENLNV